MNKNKITFVTSYLKIYDDDYDKSKTFEKRLSLFMKIVNLGINICIFTSEEFKSYFHDISEKFHNVKLMDICSIDTLEFTKLGREHCQTQHLPCNRSHIKDLPNYMYLMHSKIEFIKKTIDVNPFDTNFFCWFDFSLPYIFKNIDQTLHNIQLHSTRNYIDKFITLPGCWNYKVNDINYLKNKIAWRFCGGFFIGDKVSLSHFYDTSISHFVEFLNLTDNTLVWEVNYWAWLEANNYISPIWYNADHNDTIVNIPETIYTENILNISTNLICYNYPNLPIVDDKFFPSSASYVYDDKNKKHILNTRYVNYYYKDNWDCDFFNNTRQIRTINICSELDDKFCPKYYKVIYTDETNLKPNLHFFSQGLEDIRLYNDEIENKIKFIASNINYIPFCKNRMIIGDYDYENNACTNCKIINMTWETNCEKNWVPLPLNEAEKRKLFVYKWSPYTVGFITDDNNFQINIEKQFENPLVNLFRGSTPFIKYTIDNMSYYLGLVHYSEKGAPPIYYHSLVLLDVETKLPLFYSDVFKFGDKPIEFCIGFSIDYNTNEYLFWISQMDREPLLIKININKIPILNKFT